MARAYQYNAAGYFAGELEDYGLQPHNATRTAPEIQAGHIPRWNGLAWEAVENHKGKQGYVKGEAFTVKDYGPLPEGWSDTPPEPTPEELAARRKTEIKARLAELDAASVRPLRAAANGEASREDRERLAALDAEAAELRAELAALPPGPEWPEWPETGEGAQA